MTKLEWFLVSIVIAQFALLALQAASLERHSRKLKVQALIIERFEEGTESEDADEDIHVFAPHQRATIDKIWMEQHTIGHEDWRAP